MVGRIFLQKKSKKLQSPCNISPHFCIYVDRGLAVATNLNTSTIMKSRVLKSLISLLGFGSFVACDYSPDMYGCPPIHAPEYGCPYVEYSVDISVSDEDTQAPIKDIKVSLMGRQISDDGGSDIVDTLAIGQTDTDGKANIVGGGPVEYDRYFLTVEDIDGEANGGLYESEVVALSTPNTTHHNVRAELSKKDDE